MFDVKVHLVRRQQNRVSAMKVMIEHPQIGEILGGALAKMLQRIVDLVGAFAKMSVDLDVQLPGGSGQRLDEFGAANNNLAQAQPRLDAILVLVGPALDQFDVAVMACASRPPPHQAPERGCPSATCP